MTNRPLARGAEDQHNPHGHNYQMNIRVRVCPKSTRYRNRSRTLPVSLQLLLAGCVSEKVHLSLRFLLAMRYRAASASLRRPWEYNQRGDSGMNLKETSLKAVYSSGSTCRGRRRFTQAVRVPHRHRFHGRPKADSPRDRERGLLNTCQR